jgi:hypothetical protein
MIIRAAISKLPENYFTKGRKYRNQQLFIAAICYPIQILPQWISQPSVKDYAIDPAIRNPTSRLKPEKESHL